MEKTYSEAKTINDNVGGTVMNCKNCNTKFKVTKDEKENIVYFWCKKCQSVEIKQLIKKTDIKK
jgi:peptide subunit release factor 1 (eRF1)